MNTIVQLGPWLLVLATMLVLSMALLICILHILISRANRERIKRENDW